MDHSELEELIAAHERAIRTVLRGLLRCGEDVEDCYQATLVVAWRRILSIAPGARRAWLMQVAKNQALQLHRRTQRGKDVIESYLREPTAGPCERQDDPGERVQHDEFLQRVRHALNNLPAPQREVICLRIDHGKTFQQISEHLNIPLGTALTRMRLGLEKLNERLRDPS